MCDSNIPLIRGQLGTGKCGQYDTYALADIPAKKALLTQFYGRFKPVRGGSRFEPRSAWPQASWVSQLVKNPPAMRKTPVRFLGQEDPMEKG